MMEPSIFDVFGFSSQGWGPLLMASAATTFAVAVCGLLAGGVFGALGCWAKVGGRQPLPALATAYTTVLRGIPELLVIYLFYFGGSAALTRIGTWMGAGGFVGIPGAVAGVLAIGITSGAQLTEVFRGACNAVSRGELEAAVACGMPRLLRLRRILVPLTLRHAMPGIGNVWQMVLKASALISVTGVADLLGRAQIGANATGMPFDFFFAAALLFLLISACTGRALRATERFYARGVRQR
ncbi:ABC transporter permease [Cupriavidus sp. USMAHM13]|nr:ABC transporter permease [Cupriavidus sp. USMAHM13]